MGEEGRERGGGPGGRVSEGERECLGGRVGAGESVVAKRECECVRERRLQFSGY